MTELTALAAELRSRHRPGEPLVLVNAWDVESARRIAAAGAPAVATSSAAIAASLGEPDDPTASVDALLAAVGRICAAVTVPVTADLLDGYGLDADELVDRLLAAGAVGCNVEDSDHATPGSLVDTARAADRLAAIRAAAGRAGVDIVLNARIDAYRHRGPGATDEVLARARCYLDAGADCVYPLGLRDPEVVREVVAAAGGPVNANLDALDASAVAAIADAGASRISIGPQAFVRAYAALDAVASDLTRSTTVPPSSTPRTASRS